MGLKHPSENLLIFVEINHEIKIYPEIKVPNGHVRVCIGSHKNQYRVSSIKNVKKEVQFSLKTENNRSTKCLQLF
jgi:hypothetical protein